MKTTKQMEEQLNYAGYKRKSSEDRERQVLSIESQDAWAENIATQRNITIRKSYKEEKSAKTPYLRPEFDQMIKDIRSGKINAIICWKLDRLARNPEEAGIVMGILGRGEIQHIITSDREYRPEDSVIISYVDFAMADQYVRDLSKNVKRGLHTKTQKGWRNSQAPLGYLNTKLAEKGTNYIYNDPERFDLVQRILRMYLEEHYSTRQILHETHKWGLTTRQSKRQGGKPLGVSHIYRILSQTYYCGWFWANNPNTGQREFVKGAHEPMITPEEYDRIQIKLGHKGKPRPYTGHFQPFNGKIECGECGSMVTTDIKYQMICPTCKPQSKFSYRNTDACPRCGTKIEAMENPVIVEYSYHACTRKKGQCKQKSIRSAELLSTVDKALERFQISDCFAQWALEELAKENVETTKTQKAVIESQDDRYQKVVVQLHNLVLLYTSPENSKHELLTPEEYAPQRQALLTQKKALEDARQDVGRKVEEWVDWAENSFDFATAARVWFENGTPEEKRDIFFSLSGSNLVLKDKEVRVYLKKPLDLYSAIALKYPSTKVPLELTKGGSTQEECLPFSADIPALRAM
jgi:site-specific DNA recombinase